VADIINASSGYQTGALDTATTLVDNVSPTAAKHINGPATGIIQIETILGTGTTLKGSAADLATRLAVCMNADGTLKLATDAAITGPLSVAKGGTGVATLADGGVLVGNGTGVAQVVAVPSAGRVLVASGTAATDPAWETGLLYHGPLSCGASSTRSHEGTVVVSSNGNYSGIHYYTDFTLNSGITMTVPDGKRRLIIVATGTITINGTIDAAGAGAPATAVSPSTPNPGTDQPGGGAGTGGAGADAGGEVIHNGCLYQVGGTAGGATGGAGTQLTGSDIPGLSEWLSAMGGGSGGSTTTTVGAKGGGTIVLIAPTIVLANTAVLNTSGENGGGAGDGCGGGGAGNVYIACRSYTDNGAIFTMTGGVGSATTFPGGDGAAGVRQILIYA